MNAQQDHEVDHLVGLMEKAAASGRSADPETVLLWADTLKRIQRATRSGGERVVCPRCHGHKQVFSPLSRFSKDWREPQTCTYCRGEGIVLRTQQDYPLPADLLTTPFPLTMGGL